MTAEIKTKLDTFFSKYQRQEYSSGEIIMRSNDKVDYIFYLSSGEVKQYLIDEGEQINLHVFSKGSFFPMMLFISETENRYSFQAITDVVIYKAPAAEVLEFVKSNSDISFDLASRFAMGISKLLLKIEGLLYKGAYEKVISILIFLSEKFGKVNELGLTTIPLELTHSDIASWAGIQRETASRQLEILLAKGIINYKNQIISLDKEKLLLEKERKRTNAN